MLTHKELNFRTCRYDRNSLIKLRFNRILEPKATMVL